MPGQGSQLFHILSHTVYTVLEYGDLQLYVE